MLIPYRIHERLHVPDGRSGEHAVAEVHDVRSVFDEGNYLLCLFADSRFGSKKEGRIQVPLE